MIIPKLPNPIRRTRRPPNAIRNLAPSDQTNNNRGADNERQHKAINAVPGRSPAAGFGAHVGVVEEVEGEELGNEGVFDGHEDGGPGYGGADYADHVAGVALCAAVLGPFEAPVDGAEEGEDLLHYQLWAGAM